MLRLLFGLPSSSPRRMRLFPWPTTTTLYITQVDDPASHTHHHNFIHPIANLFLIILLYCGDMGVLEAVAAADAAGRIVVWTETAVVQ